MIIVYREDETEGGASLFVRNNMYRKKRSEHYE